MREPKFRAWDKIHEKYREPMVYDILNDKIVVRLPIETLKKGEFLLEQYTGLKDKNGKEIYEGDIVRYAFECPEGEWVEEVSFGKISDGEGYYHDYFLAWRTTDKDGDDHQSLLDLEGYCEVIGNIHENPELLEGGK